LANNGDFRVACSVWSENTAAAMEIARNVKAATVWINAHHLYDAAVGAAGSSGSGWPVFGKDVSQIVPLNFYQIVPLNFHQIVPFIFLLKSFL
jgi:acyl-CoA reductase-like NAD-dependent aldehyde dehydrogenase